MLTILYNYVLYNINYNTLHSLIYYNKYLIYTYVHIAKSKNFIENVLLALSIYVVT